MPPDPIRFHFDFISPYAFLAWTQIRGIAERHSRELLLVPVLFAGMLDAHGTKGPAEVPAKRMYLFQDVARKAFRYGITDLAPPPAHPFNPLTALRVASLPDLDDKKRERIVDALFAAAWTQRKAIDTPASVAAILNDLGLDGASLVAAAQRDDVKAHVRNVTEAAIATGSRWSMFGVPTIDVGEERFWGTDSLADLEAFLRGDLPNFAKVAEAFASLPIGVMRKAVQ